MCDRSNADRDPPLTIVEECGAFVVYEGERALTAPFWHRAKAEEMLALLQAKNG